MVTRKLFITLIFECVVVNVRVSEIRAIGNRLLMTLFKEYDNKSDGKALTFFLKKSVRALPSGIQLKIFTVPYFNVVYVFWLD